MKYNLVLSEKALFQIDKAATWFFDQKEDLAKLFLLEIDKNLKYIQKHPLKSQFRYKFVRIRFLKQFSFVKQ